MEPSASNKQRERRKRRRREKMIKIQGTTQTSHDNDDDISESKPMPPDIIFEILSRLPTKSIVRFQFVSKLWSSITATPEFTKAWSSASSPTPCVLLIFRQRGDQNVFAFSSPIQERANPHDPYHPRVVNYRFESLMLNHRFDSAHGLVCLETSSRELMIWNPTTRRVFSLPKLEGKSTQRYLLGYDPIDGKHKALCCITGGEIGILTLGAQESWRFISEGIPKHIPITAYGKCINGVIYYEAFMCLASNYAIMSFDLRSEKLNFIKHPKRQENFLMVSYEGRLALVTSISYDVELLILEDAEKHKWSYKSFSLPSPCEEWKWKGITDAGEFIFTPGGNGEYTHVKKSLYESFSVFYFDPKKHTTREVRFGGIGFDDIRRLDQVGFDFRYELAVIPNHTESFMSL